MDERLNSEVEMGVFNNMNKCMGPRSRKMKIWVGGLLFFIACAGTSMVPSEKRDKNVQVAEVQQEPVYFDENRVQFEDRTYKGNIRTVLMYKTGFDLSGPVIELGTDQSITLRFDDLDDQTKDYYYQLVHCTWDWQPSGMLESDYIDGMWNDRIHNRDLSFNTLIPFIHYSLQLPNQNTRIKRSGNYILLIYENNDPEDVVLTRRLMVYENEMEVKARVRDARASSERQYKQEVELTVTQKELRVTDPFGQLQLVLLQNMRWDDMRTPKPQYLRGNELLYRDSEDLVFPGGNEYRNFDIKTLRFNTANVKSIELGNTSTTVTLLPSKKRNISVYRAQADLNGRYIIKNEDGYDAHLESDYVEVRFTLEGNPPYRSGNVHVFGNLSDGRISEENKMVYSEKLGVYFLQMLLKQGFYDYQYAFLADTAQIADLGFIEGDHSETENDMLALVYYHDFSGNYDRIVGMRFFNTMRDRY